MRRVRLAPSFRQQRVHAAIVLQVAAAVARGVRVVEYSVQHDHLHLLVEAEDKKELAKHLKLLFSRIAFAVNAVARRHGTLFGDRHHRRELRTPTEVRRVLVYLFFNGRKHDIQHGRVTNATFALDAMTSAPWFHGWDPLVRPSAEAFERARAHHPSGSPACAPGTWLSAVGWKRAGGPIRFNEVPRLP